MFLFFINLWSLLVAKSTGFAVDCNDHLSCESKTVTGWLSCDGFLSCLDVSYQGSDYVFVTGASGALSLQTKVNQIESLFANAAVAFHDSYLKFRSTSDIFLYGGLAIMNSTLINDDSVADTFDKLDAYSYGAVTHSVVGAVKNVVANGYYSLYNSNITLSDGGNIQLSARMAGYGATIYCPPNTDCQISCNTPTACYGMAVVCGLNSDCDISCDESNGIWCPQPHSTASHALPHLSVDTQYLPTNQYIVQALSGINSSVSRSDDYMKVVETFCSESCLDSGDCKTDDSPSSWPEQGTAYCMLGSNGVTLESPSLAPDTTQSPNFLKSDASREKSDYDVYAMGLATGLSWDSDFYKNIYAMGELTMYDSKLLQADEVVSCQGAEACASCKEIRAETVYCLANEACAQSRIVGASQVYLFGADALENGTIATEKGTAQSLTVYLEICQPAFTVECVNADDECVVYVFRQDFEERCLDSGFEWKCHENAVCEMRFYEEDDDLENMGSISEMDAISENMG